MKPDETTQLLEDNILLELFNGYGNQDIFNTLTVDDLFSDFNRRIYKAIQEMASNGQLLDPYAIAEKAKYPFTYITDVMTQRATSPALLFDLEGGVNKLKERAAARHTVLTAQNIATRIMNGDQITAVIPDGVEALKGIMVGSGTVKGPNLDSQVDRMLADIQYRRDNPGVSGLATGLHAWDQVTDGLKEGQHHIVGADTGEGKSGLSCSVTTNLLKKGEGVAYFSHEMPDTMLLTRIVANIIKVDSQQLLRGKVPTHKQQQFIDAMQWLKRAPLSIFDSGPDVSPTRTVDQIRTAVFKLLDSGFPARLIIIDHFHNTEPSKTTSNETMDYSRTSRALTAIAKESGIAIMSLCQLNRNNVNRADKRPIKSDLKNTGSLAEDACTLSFLYRPNKDNQMVDDNIMEIIVRKNRYGGVGTAYHRFMKEWAGVENAA